jgi:hypothetical protein
MLLAKAVRHTDYHAALGLQLGEVHLGLVLQQQNQYSSDTLSIE